jgi:uncharacterized membrane protein YsdA (DUF1294 family)
MCCNGLKILVLFSFVIAAFLGNGFFPSLPVIVWYLILLNIFTFFLFIIDKYYSLHERKRVPEATLYFLSAAGGVYAECIAMVLLKHKIRKKSFLFIQVFILILWSIAIYEVIIHLENILQALKELTK